LLSARWRGARERRGVPDDRQNAELALGDALSFEDRDARKRIEDIVLETIRRMLRA
jgi:hypothetical protein